jgi:uncharacterized iron-regulated protein
VAITGLALFQKLAKSAYEGSAKQVVDSAIDKTIDALLPGPTPEMAKSFQEAISAAKQTTQNAGKSATILTEKNNEKK